MDVQGEKIRQFRLNKGWSQQHLADACEVNLRTIQRVENHGVAAPETVLAITVALEVKKEQFLKTRGLDLSRMLPKSDIGVLLLFLATSAFGAVLGVVITFWLTK